MKTDIPIAGERLENLHIPCAPEPTDNPLSFHRGALANLVPGDRILFEKFGMGPDARPSHSCIHRAFEAHAARQPDTIAADHLGETITYGELNHQADRLAILLRDMGVRPGDHVGLFLQRSIAMLIGILASLKLGAAYVPQHVGVAPEKSLRHIVDVAGIRVILGLECLKEDTVVPAGCHFLGLDRLMQQPIGKKQKFTPDYPVQAEQTAFLLFTSGTTGTPNGVQVSHGNLCNILLTRPGNLGMAPGKKVGQILSIAFDMAAWEILGALANGATLMVRGKSIQDTAEKADVLIATPSILASLDANRCRRVKTAAVAGEPCPRPLADKWGSFCHFYNSCGPTETTIINTAARHTPDRDRLTIGAPTPNNTVYILDENLAPLPIGEVGEMWAGGDCVSQGYLGNAALTEERYRDDPFLGEGRKMFRTRDLGRWTPEGELEHFGRTDDQVKVRGFRVELDSVSAALEKVPGCGQAVTLKLDDRRLVSFVSPAGIPLETAKDSARRCLPYYAVPDLILALDDLPRTPRGKLDKRLLLDIATQHDQQKAAAE